PSAFCSKTVVVLCSKRGISDDDESTRAVCKLEQSGRVENFPNGSEPACELKIRRASALGAPPPGTNHKARAGRGFEPHNSSTNELARPCSKMSCDRSVTGRGRTPGRQRLRRHTISLICFPNHVLRAARG